MADNNTLIQHHWSNGSFKNFSDPKDFDALNSEEIIKVIAEGAALQNI